MLQGKGLHGVRRGHTSSFAFTAVAVLGAVAAVGLPSRTSDRTPAVVRPRVNSDYGKLPLHFEANQGQTADEVKFMARGSGYGLFLTPTESVLVLRKTRDAEPPAVLRMKLLGANPGAVVAGREELPGKSNYFIGNDPKKWRTNVAQYARVEYREVYPGVDLAYYGNQGQIEYDFIVKPGADPRKIAFGIEGAEAIRVDRDGNLLLSLPDGEVVHRAPVVYQEIDGVRKAVDGRFVLREGRDVGFELGAYAADLPLVLDPVLVYSTYLGGSDYDQANGLAVDAFGNGYVTGFTASTDFPVVAPVQPAHGGGSWDVFVAKLNAAGNALVYSTYLGGSSSDYGWGIAVDASGSAYVVGDTNSSDFPTANPLQASPRGTGDAFVTKLNATGSALIYSTYLGGGAYDAGFGIAVDTSGSAYVTGATSSSDFPIANALQPSNAGARNAFITKFDAAGSTLVYSTYLGGSYLDTGLSIAVDESGNAYVTGYAYSTDFPVANALQAANAGLADAFVTKVNAAGSALVYSTYLGGSDGDTGTSIALDVFGNAYCAGYTGSTDFPTANPLQASNGGQLDGFVAKLNAAGSGLVYATYLGGSSDDAVNAIAVNASGDVYLTGETTSTNFPIANAVQASYGGNEDAFVAKLNAGGSSLVYSSYLGGRGGDKGSGIGVDAWHNAYVTGSTSSTDWPTSNAFQALFRGARDIVVAKIRDDGPSQLFILAPCRIADTSGAPGPSGGPALAANTTRTFPAAGACGIPATAKAIAAIVTTAQQTDFGDLRVYAAGDALPGASTLNFAVNHPRANNAIVSLGTAGQIAVTCDMPPGSSGATRLIVDVYGYFE